MAPIPDENRDNPADTDPNHAEELETPNHIIPPAHDSSSDDDDFDSDTEGPAGDGYVLLPQGPEEDEEGGSGDVHHPQAWPPPSALDGLPSEPMTEMRGAGVDLTEAIAQGNVHPAFVANFEDNKVPEIPKTMKEDVLWNQSPTTTGSQRLQLDSDHLSKVKSAMAGFQLPAANIPDWVKQVPEDQWKQRIVGKLTSPAGETNKLTSGSKTRSKQSAAVTDTSSGEASHKKINCSEEWPGTGGT
ncbi:male-enhanced antigen 1-like isoform X2 [Littorina saxatilis]|uniref:Male-enhanced antigen 1 n=1 Tax=Littorina saxatilis TaxID=31220 RepID=A0AAN9GDW0_9CAEN